MTIKVKRQSSGHGGDPDVDEDDVCPDGYCRECHVSLSFEACCDGSWVREKRRAGGLPVEAT